MRKGQTNMRLYRISEKKSLIIPHYGASRETRCLKVVRGLLQLAYFVYAKSESPGEVMRISRLVGAFATCQCNKNHDHFVCWPIYSINFSLRTVYFIFLFSIIIWIAKISKHCLSLWDYVLLPLFNNTNKCMPAKGCWQKVIPQYKMPDMPWLRLIHINFNLMDPVHESYKTTKVIQVKNQRGRNWPTQQNHEMP